MQAAGLLIMWPLLVTLTAVSSYFILHKANQCVTDAVDDPTAHVKHADDLHPILIRAVRPWSIMSAARVVRYLWHYLSQEVTTSCVWIP